MHVYEFFFEGVCRLHTGHTTDGHTQCGKARRGTYNNRSNAPLSDREVGSEPRKSSLTHSIMTALVERLPLYARASLLLRVPHEWEEYGMYTLF
jgi:hypothetical protein